MAHSASHDVLPNDTSAELREVAMEQRDVVPPVDVTQEQREPVARPGPVIEPRWLDIDTPAKYLCMTRPGIAVFRIKAARRGNVWPWRTTQDTLLSVREWLAGPVAGQPHLVLAQKRSSRLWAPRQAGRPRPAPPARSARARSRLARRSLGGGGPPAPLSIRSPETRFRDQIAHRTPPTALGQ